MKNCRIGITPDPEARKRYWESLDIELHDWRILKTFETREEAISYLEHYASKYGCMTHSHGKPGPGPWHVYFFKCTIRKN